MTEGKTISISLMGSREGAVVSAPGIDSGPVPYIHGLSLLMVLAQLQGFFSGFSSFPPSTETNTPNSNSTGIENPHENQPRLMWLPL